MKQAGPSSPASTGRAPARDRFEAVERVFLATILVVVPLALTTGFSRYEVLKQGLLAALGALLGVSAVVGFCRGRSARVVPTGLALGAIILTLVHLAGLAWAPLLAEGMPRLVPAVGLTLVLLSAASQRRSGDWVVGPLVASSGLAALAVLLQRFGVLSMPAIPTGVAHDAGAHGVFDHAREAATFLAATAPLGLYWAATRGEGSRALSRLAGLVVAVLAYLALGICGGPAVLVAGITLVLGFVLGLSRLKGARHGMSVWGGATAALVALAMGSGAIGPAPAPAPDPFAELRRSAWDEFGLPTQENTVTSAREWSFEADRAVSVWQREGLLGAGLGAYAAEAGRAIDPSHPYYTSPRDERHLHATPPSLLLGVPYELGHLGVAALGLFLVMALGTLLRGTVPPKEPDADAAGAGRAFALAGGWSALTLLLLTPAAYHAGEGVAVMAVLGWSAAVLAPRARAFGLREIAPAASGFGRFERWVLVGAPLLLAIALATYGAVGRVDLDFARQRGNVYFEAGQLRSAIPEYERALASEPDDALSNYHLGMALYLTPSDPARRTRAARHLARAAQLAPYDVRIGMRAVDVATTRASQEPSEQLEIVRRRQQDLERLRDLDPLEADVSLLLAEVHEIGGDYEEALRILQGVIESNPDERAVARAHLEAGIICQEQTSQPEQALEHLRAALRGFGQGAPEARRILERIEEIEQGPSEGEFGHGH